MATDCTNALDAAWAAIWKACCKLEYATPLYSPKFAQFRDTFLAEHDLVDEVDPVAALALRWCARRGACPRRRIAPNRSLYWSLSASPEWHDWYVTYRHESCICSLPWPLMDNQYKATLDSLSEAFNWLGRRLLFLGVDDQGVLTLETEYVRQFGVLRKSMRPSINGEGWSHVV